MSLVSPQDAAGNFEFAVSRYNPDGTPDLTFGSGGSGSAVPLETGTCARAGLAMSLCRDRPEMAEELGKRIDAVRRIDGLAMHGSESWPPTVAPSDTATRPRWNALASGVCCTRATNSIFNVI
jgi:hypothetical protein